MDTLPRIMFHRQDIAIDTASVTNALNRDVDKSDDPLTSSSNSESDVASPQSDFVTPQSDLTTSDHLADAQSPRPRAGSFGFLRRKPSHHSGRNESTLSRKKTMTKKEATRPIMPPRIPSEVIAQLDNFFPIPSLVNKYPGTPTGPARFFPDPTASHNRHQQHSHASKPALTMLAQLNAQSTAGTHEHDEAVDMNMMTGSMANRGRYVSP